MLRLALVCLTLACETQLTAPSDLAAVSDAAASDAAVADIGPPPATSPIEPIWPSTGEAAARVKSPGQMMRFTVGHLVRILGDANDPNAWMCPPGHPPYACPDSSMTFFVDGAPVGTLPPDPDNQNLWDLRLPAGLAAGDHVLTVQFTPHAAAPVGGLVPVYIHVEAAPTRPNRISLSGDLVLSGSTPLDWVEAVVIGNGHRVTAAPGYSGKITVRNSFVSGLADFDQLGIDVVTSGAVEISGSIFEATAPLRLTVNGSGAVVITGNEFRANNFVTFVSSDPERSPILELSGGSSGEKRFQGNNIASGIVQITGMSGWQIGGLRDGESNILIGPRCVLQVSSTPQMVIQGNYLHHDYYGGFSQGFNLRVDGTSDILAEHNVIRDGSWPLQSFGGEFRYNLMVNSGHDLVRSAADGTRFHHNVLVHAQGTNSGYNGALLFYSGESNLVFDHNTVDLGGAVGGFASPFLVLADPGVHFSSVSGNVFSQALDASEGSFLHGSGQIAQADYNLWHNPLASQTAHYQAGLVAGTAGAHDLDADPRFSGSVPEAPYRIDEGLVWRRQYRVSEVLAWYRALYTPQGGSPLIGNGPAGSHIGAVGDGEADDQFGRVLQP